MTGESVATVSPLPEHGIDSFDGMGLAQPEMGGDFESRVGKEFDALVSRIGDLDIPEDVERTMEQQAARKGEGGNDDGGKHPSPLLG